MECTYDQLLEYYFTNNIEPKRNINISSLMELIKKDKNEIMNAIQEIKNKKGRKERKDAELKLDESMTSFRNFERKFLEKDNEDNTINNLITNRLTDFTIHNGIINFIEKKFVNNNNNNLYETDEFNNLDNRDVVFYKSDDKIMKPFFSPIQKNDSLANLYNINTNSNNNDFPSPIQLNRYYLGDNDN